MELALDTSSSYAGLVLSEQGKPLGELSWQAENRHSVSLAPNILYLLKLVNAKLRDLNAIIVVIGPGSFSGVRAGVAMAKGLAFALKIPLVGVSSLEVIAFPWIKMGLPICPLLPQGKDWAAALFLPQDGGLKRLKEEQIVFLEEVFSWTEDMTIFCGEFTSGIEAYMKEKKGEKALVVSYFRRPGDVASLGWQKLKGGKIAHPFALEPLYLLPPKIILRKP